MIRSSNRRATIARSPCTRIFRPTHKAPAGTQHQERHGNDKQRAKEILHDANYGHVPEARATGCVALGAATDDRAGDVKIDTTTSPGDSILTIDGMSVFSITFEGVTLFESDAAGLLLQGIDVGTL